VDISTIVVLLVFSVYSISQIFGNQSMYVETRVEHKYGHFLDHGVVVAVVDADFLWYSYQCEI